MTENAGGGPARGFAMSSMKRSLTSTPGSFSGRHSGWRSPAQEPVSGGCRCETAGMSVARRPAPSQAQLRGSWSQCMLPSAWKCSTFRSQVGGPNADYIITAGRFMSVDPGMAARCIEPPCFCRGLVRQLGRSVNAKASRSASASEAAWRRRPGKGSDRAALSRSTRTPGTPTLVVHVPSRDTKRTRDARFSLGNDA